MVHIEQLRKDFARRLKEAAFDAQIQEWGLGAHLAALTGKTAKAASKWINAESMPGRANMEVIAKALGVRTAWLQHGEMPKGRGRELPTQDGDALGVIPGTAVRDAIRRTPVVGTAQLGNEGYWSEIDYPVGHGDGYVDAPSLDAGAYALRVKGDSMAPAIRNGWIVLVEPNASTHPGELVVVCLQDGRCMVKEYLYERDGSVTLGSVNQDHKPVTVDRNDVTRFHHVGAIIPPSKWQPI